MIFNIIKEESYEVNKEMIEKMKKIVFRNKITAITIGFKMVKDIGIILNAIGDSYLRLITAKPNLEYGEVNFFTEDQKLTIRIISKTLRLNTVELDHAIIVDKASYLLMNNNTLIMLTNGRYDDIDQYSMNNNAYYHSYKKVPIGICEFLETGKIELIYNYNCR